MVFLKKSMDLPNRTYILLYSMYVFLLRKTRLPPHKNTGRGGYPEVSLKRTFFSIQSSEKLIISGDPVFLWNLSGQEIQTSRAATPQMEFLLLPNWNSIYVMIKPNVSLCVYIYIYVHVPCASSRCHKARNVPINPLQTGIHRIWDSENT